MKKKTKILIIVFVILALIIAALVCWLIFSKKTDNNVEQNTIPVSNTNTELLENNIKYSVEDDDLNIKIKTSAKFDKENTFVVICNQATYTDTESFTGKK